MNHRPRLALFLAQILVPMAGCGGGADGPTAPELDDIACLDVGLGAPCPDDATAATTLIGMQTCEDPVREVIATGAYVSESDVVYTGYGGYFPYESGDTGFAGPNTRCCYEAAYEIHEGESCTIGRPLRVAGRTVSARGVARGDWVGAPSPRVRGLSAARRAELAEAWARDGLLEHASVAAFARVALELTALGAPPELLARTAAAMGDEVRHAEDCFALASAYAGRPVGPGPLPVPSRRRASLQRLAVETLVEGCVGETLAVARAAHQLRDETDPVVRAVLERIIADETRHAELAWDVLQWAVRAGGPRVRRAVAQAAAGLEVSEPELAPVLAAVIEPTVAELLAA